MTKTKFILASMALALAIATPATAQLQPKTGTEPKMFDRTGRLQQDFFPYVRTLATTSCVTTATVAAAATLPTSATMRNNVHGSIVNYAPGATWTGLTVTTSIAVMAYAGKVQIAISDPAGDTVPVCRGYEIRGDSWNGAPQSEIVPFTQTTIVSETVWLTTSKSWSRITYFRLTGCDSMDADDIVMVRQSPHIALRWKISPRVTTEDALRVCLINIGAGASAANHRCTYPSNLSWDTDYDANTVNVLDLDLGPGSTVQTCPTDGSSFMVTYRTSPNTNVYP